MIFDSELRGDLFVEEGKLNKIEGLRREFTWIAFFVKLINICTGTAPPEKGRRIRISTAKGTKKKERERERIRNQPVVRAFKIPALRAT
jgi:hypothetical protein